MVLQFNQWSSFWGVLHAGLLTNLTHAVHNCLVQPDYEIQCSQEV